VSYPLFPFDALVYSSCLRTLRILVISCALLGCSRRVAAVRDDLGRPVDVAGGTRRIVTLAPNLTEILFAIGAGDRVVATDDFSDTPDAARKLPKVGGVQPNVEAIVAAVQRMYYPVEDDVPTGSIDVSALRAAVSA